MSTIRAEQADREYTMILSNKGLRVEFDGQEIFRHWPDDVPGEPTPEPTPEPEPTPDPEPEPEPDPDPTPEPEPEPDPTPNPDPNPVPAPVPNPPGTAVKTDAELITALGNAKAGDVIDFVGDFGSHSFSGIRPSIKVTLRGHGATLERLQLFNCANLAFDAIKFVGRNAAPTSGAKPYLLKGDKGTDRISVIGCDFWGAIDADQFRNWALSKWRGFSWGAAMFEGDDIVLDDNAALGVNFGFNVTGNRVAASGLRVCGFSADSFRFSAYALRAKDIWSTDAYVIDGNHPDGIQGFDRNGTLSDQVIEDAIIMEYSTPTDQRGAIGASLQLIGYHDGPYADLTFRRFVGSCSSLNAFHVNNCARHTAEHVTMFTVPGPKGGSTRLRVPSSSALTDVRLDKYVGGTAPTTGKPDYSKLDAFRVAALRGAQKPDLRAIMGW